MNLYYERCGAGQPLIMLHGNGEDCTIFRKAASVLQRYYTVYCLDSRGHGKSPRVSEYHYADMAQDVVEFIETMHLEKPVLYGFSDGGIIALLIAIDHPDLLDRVIGSGVNVRPDGLKPGWMKIFRWIYEKSPSPLFKLMLTEPNITPEMLQKITVPVTLFGGDRDMIQRSHMQEIARNIPNGVFKEIPHANHSSYIVNSKEIAHLILQETGKQ